MGFHTLIEIALAEVTERLLAIFLPYMFFFFFFKSARADVNAFAWVSHKRSNLLKYSMLILGEDTRRRLHCFLTQFRSSPDNDKY